jgi:hypothetical protein
VIHELAFEDYSMTGQGGVPPSPQNFQEWSDYPPDGPPTTEAEFVTDVIETLAGTGGTISVGDLSLITPEEWESFLAALLGFVSEPHGTDQNSYYNDHSNEAPLGEYFIEAWGWLPSIQNLPGYHYFDYLTQGIDSELMEWVFAAHEGTSNLTHAGVSMADIENLPFAMIVNGRPIMFTWHSGAAPAGNFQTNPNDPDAIVITAIVGYWCAEAVPGPLTGADQEHGPYAWDFTGMTSDVLATMHFVGEALDYLRESPTARAVLLAAKLSGARIVVALNEETHTVGNVVHWNPYAGLRLANGDMISPALALIHELAHTYGGVTPTYDPIYDTMEERRVMVTVENAVARELGEPIRTDHHSSTWVTNATSVTEHTPKPPQQ